MVFTVLAAVDFHQKCNFEFTFPTCPTISELRERLEMTLSTEAALRRPAGVPLAPFVIHRIQVFDERMEMWVDLVSSSQLADYCQLYVFQRESPWHKDTPGRIPPPVRPSQPLNGFAPVGFQGSPGLMSAAVPGHLDPMLLRQPPAYVSASPYRTGIPVSPPIEPVAMGIGATTVRISPPRLHHATPPRDMLAFGMGEAYGVASLVPEVITHSEKIRVVFEELDNRKSRSISYDDWQSAFARLRLVIPDGPFTEETCHDLFYKKADKNEDGYVSFSEFQLFGEVYPKLLDSLYFRCRDQVHHDSRAQNMDAARALQGELEKRRDDATGELDEAENAVRDAQQNEETSGAAVETAKELEKDARQQKDEAHGQTEEVRGRLRDAQVDRDKVKEGVRQKDASLRSSQRAVDAAVKKEKAQEGELDKAKKELERLQKLVEAQQREVQRQEGLLSDASASIQNAEGKVRENESAKGAAENELNAAQSVVQGIEQDLKTALDHETTLAQTHRDTVKEVNQAQAHKNHEDAELAKATAREVQKKAALDRAIRALEDHDKVVEALENKDRELEERRAAEEARENEILEQEVRLREQRECMEKKEEALRNAHQDFTNDSGRASPLRSRLAPGYATMLSA
ncbi:calmodulin-like protein containing EF hand domain [Diplonema papillatum]|nr:calmodulin-like protein containing EF hand domain [Diplonema papillatum]